MSQPTSACGVQPASACSCFSLLSLGAVSLCCRKGKCCVERPGVHLVAALPPKLGTRRVAQPLAQPLGCHPLTRQGPRVRGQGSSALSQLPLNTRSGRLLPRTSAGPRVAQTKHAVVYSKERRRLAGAPRPSLGRGRGLWAPSEVAQMRGRPLPGGCPAGAASNPHRALLQWLDPTCWLCGRSMSRQNSQRKARRRQWIQWYGRKGTGHHDRTGVQGIMID